MEEREQRQPLIRPNFSLSTDYEELFPVFDIPSGSRYHLTTTKLFIQSL
jgi:hypothetical protein